MAEVGSWVLRPSKMQAGTATALPAHPMFRFTVIWGLNSPRKKERERERATEACEKWSSCIQCLLAIEGELWEVSHMFKGPQAKGFCM